MRVTVDVVIDGRTANAGVVFLAIRGGEVTSSTFNYSADYLADPAAYSIDPALPFYRGSHNIAGIPGSFSDCSPDRWGQNLIKKQIQAEARRDGTTPPTVTKADHLLRVHDLSRQGALRFRIADGPHLDPASDIPKLIELPRLLSASDAYARDPDALTDIKTLLDAGSATLGGARPKASVRDGEQLHIAKFPHHMDEWDVMGWEATALDLAERAEIETPPHRLAKVDGRSVLILDRFDRHDGQRIGYMSAMTMLETQDGGFADYVELAETMPEYVASPDVDLPALWRRIAFYVLINNTDDHLRNHGFLRHGRGWRLSPVFDVNPNPDPTASRATTIGGATGSEDEVEALLSYAEAFRLDTDEARHILAEVVNAAGQWREVAAANGISRPEIDRFAYAFEPPGLVPALETVRHIGAPADRTRHTESSSHDIRAERASALLRQSPRSRREPPGLSL